jgi:transposase
MFALNSTMTVYVHRAPIDFRKNINGLAALVEHSLTLNPFMNACFVFRNRRTDKIKILFWQKNGFWLCQKRLEQDRFLWPKADMPVLVLTLTQLQWLLDGVDIAALKGHSTLSFERAS